MPIVVLVKWPGNRNDSTSMVISTVIVGLNNTTKGALKEEQI